MRTKDLAQTQGRWPCRLQDVASPPVTVLGTGPAALPGVRERQRWTRCFHAPPACGLLVAQQQCQSRAWRGSSASEGRASTWSPEHWSHWGGRGRKCSAPGVAQAPSPGLTFLWE